MGNGLESQSVAWYHDNLSLDHETFAKGFGLTMEAWNDLQSRIHQRALQVKRPVSCYRNFIPRDIALLLLDEFREQFASAECKWRIAAFEFVVKEAYSSRPQAEHDERFKDNYVPEDIPNPEPVVCEVAGAENKSTLKNESTNSVEPGQSSMTQGFTSGASSPTERSSDSLLTPSSSSEETTLSQFLIPTKLPLPKRNKTALSTRVDPVNKALKLHLYIQFEKSGYERLIGVFSTQFLLLSSKSSSPPMVSLKLVQEAALKTIEQTIRKSLSWISKVEEVFLDKWSVPDLAINEDITLNTAINEILEQGNTTATLRIPILSSHSSDSDLMLRSSGEITRPSKVTKRALTTAVHERK